MNPYKKWKQVGIWINFSQQTFQRCFNVVFCLIRRRNVGQRQINVETLLCISTLEFTTLSNVETTLSFSTLMWTTLVNVETTWKWPFPKKTKKIISNRIHRIRSFNYYFIIFLTLLLMLSWICPRVLAGPQKLFKYYERFCIART